MFFQSSSLEDRCEIVKHNETFLGSWMVVAFDLIFADVSSIIKKSDWTAEERCGFKKEHQNVVLISFMQLCSAVTTGLRIVMHSWLEP